MSQCPLCRGSNITVYYELPVQKVDKRYLQCGDCDLVFLDPAYLISNEEEKSRYATHQNDPESEGYCNFLMQLGRPLLDFVQTGAEGLDFGCGPGPTLSLLLEKEGMVMENYDPYFLDNKKVLEKKYDFITSTEVIEHMALPHKEFDLLTSLLKEGGVLAVMTQPLPSERSAFPKWWYKNDETHITFFGNKNFEYIAKNWNLEIIYKEKALTFFKKR